MPDLPFAKGHALGNDYLVLDAADLPWPLTPAFVRAFCDRHRGVGSDGVLLAELDRRPIRLRIFNPDGSEAEKSGNGLRILAAYLFGRGLVAGEPFAVALPRDEVTMQVEAAGSDGTVQVAVAIGRPSFRGADAGFLPEPGEVDGHELALAGGETVRVHPVSLGNPHCVVFVDALRRDEFLRRAPQLAAHPAFAAGTNVQFARIAGPDRLEVWVYERGAGETLASGSSACAAAAAAWRLGLARARPLSVLMPGGRLEVDQADEGGLLLRGPAQILFHGRVRREVAASWAAGE